MDPHTSPSPQGAGAYPAQQAPTTGGSHTAVWILVGVAALIVIIGVLAAIAIPVFLSQRQKAADSSAKADVATLGKEIAVWYVDHDGPPPTITVEGGTYVLDGVTVALVSDNVEFGGVTGSGSNDWCTWVHNPLGDVKDFQYSARGGLAAGTC